jgi:parallel beta-helix repeat protein
MSRTLVLVPCVFFLAIQPTPSNGADWHVNPAASYQPNQDQPPTFISLEDARDAVRAARQSRTVPEPDTIWLHPSTYLLSSPFELTHQDSGTSDAPITWKALEPHRAILSGPDASVLVAIYDAEHIRIEGLKLVNATDQAIEIAHGRYISIENCQVSEIGHTGLHLFGGRDCEITNCSVTKCGQVGIRVEAGDRAAHAAAEHLVRNCTLQDCGKGDSQASAAIHVAGVGNKVIGNWLSDCANSGIRIDGDNHRICENQLERTCLTAVNVGSIVLGHDVTETGNRIERNAIIQVGVEPRLDAIAIFLGDAASNTTIRQNIISSAGRGIAIGGGSANEVTENLIEKCTIAIQIEKQSISTLSTLLSQNNRVQRNVIQRSGTVAVDSIDTLRANQIANNLVGQQLFVLDRGSGTSALSFVALASTGHPSLDAGTPMVRFVANDQVR